MHNPKKFAISLVALIAAGLLASCAAAPRLEPMSAYVPAGVDLSGRWQLRDAAGSTKRPGGAVEDGIRIPPATSARNRGRPATARTPRRSKGGAVGVFLEHGTMLKITQTETGLFISFDRAIVEEYRFGEDRVVSVGPIEAQRVSGWQDGRFVTRTQDEAGAILTETWEMLADGSGLLRRVSLADGEGKTIDSEQRFDRI